MKLIMLFLITATTILSACGDDPVYDNNGNLIIETDGKEESKCSVSNDQCIGDNICINSICSNAFDRSYDFFVGTLRVNEKTSGGVAWDAFGGLPDPRVQIVLNKNIASSCKTTGRTDTTTASFNESCAFQFRAGDLVEIYVFDEDISDDDLMFGCELIINTSILRARELTCDSVEGNLRFSIRPRG
jgi:hypothetical protein